MKSRTVELIGGPKSGRKVRARGPFLHYDGQVYRVEKDRAFHRVKVRDEVIEWLADKCKETKGRKNVYSCGKHRIVTVIRDPGVTPACVTCPRCGEDCWSSFYRPTSGLPTWQWIRPTETEYHGYLERLEYTDDYRREDVDRSVRDFMLQGGLILVENKYLES